MSDPQRTNTTSRIREKSMFFEKIIPALLIIMAVLMTALILFAAGVLLGIIHF
jgi:hypothetical protein